MGALFSFLGGSVFRMIWGEVAAFVQKKQDHANEMESQRLQAELESGRHERDMARITLQSNLNVKEVTVMGDLAIQKVDADAFVEAIRASAVPTGVRWVDAWNGSIRPAAATIALCLWVFALASAGFITNDWDKELVGVILGFYFADRSLGKRGK
jgi:hypothetical protein